MFFKLNIKPDNRLILVIIVPLMFACSPARYLSEDEYLLSKNRIETSQKTIPEDQLKGYVIQTPNKKLLGTRFYLFLYNLSNIEKEKWPHGWLRKIGEAPVIYDSTLRKTSSEQIKQFLENKGFYNANVEDTVIFKRKNAYVTYEIAFNEPYRIKTIHYNFEDTALTTHVRSDSMSSFLRLNMRFDKDELQKERIRIDNLLKEQGFYNFSKEYIFYNATTDSEENSVELTMHIKEYSEGTPDPFTKIRIHPKYRIRNVYVFPDFSDVGLSARDDFSDTNFYRNLYFLSQGKPNIKPNAIANRNYIIPDEYYKLSDVNRTYRNLSALNIIRFTNITFKEIDTIPVFGTGKYLDCRIELTQKKLQSMQAEIAGTNSSGDLGVRGNLLYSNFNLFRGAEVFNIRLTGAIESLKNQTDNKYKSMKEIGAETNIVFPKFFSPFRLEGFVKKFAPKTFISFAFNYQSRPDFTRSIANGSFSYRWNSNSFVSHSFWPLELNYVRIYEEYSDKAWLDSISRTPLAYSFENHVVNVARYTLELNNQAIGKSRNFIYTRFNLESAGNLLHFATTRIKPHNDAEHVYTLFNVPYFQYFLGDVDLRYYNVIDKQNRFVYRLFIGAGYPYGNSTNLPYEKKYFSGGPNSIRAWKTRDLGPGSDTTSSALDYFPNKNGDIKVEANIEYRFKLIWKVEAALFLDAGNIWAFKDDEKPNAVFEWNRFYKEIALGTGFGARFDFSFFLLRFDFGLKLRDPSLQEDNRWLPVFRDFKLNDLHVNIGIGYPF